MATLSRITVREHRLPGEATLTYQPALDGLRAVAVLAVIAYHDNYAWARGGFLGVDAFFVLSGFLITTILVLEYQRADSIGLLAFWGRRARRLLPALLLVLLAVAVYGAVETSPFELNTLRGDSLSSLFYFTNWRFIAQKSSYFALYSSPSPVRHLWSLAIEEQFYFVWPFVVLACLRLGRGSRRVLVGVSVVGLVASTVVMAALYDAVDPSRVYYGTDARAHTILVGALLALWLVARPPNGRNARRGVQVAGVIGAVGMLWALHGLSDQSGGYYRGGSLLYAIAVAAVIAAVVQPTSSPLRRGLALPPMIWIGRISYGLYLWHWPVNVYLTQARVGFGGNQLDALRLLVTFALAAGSYYLLEMPIRRGALRSRPARWLVPAAVAFTGVAILASTAGAEPIPGYLTPGARSDWAFTTCPRPSAAERSAAGAAAAGLERPVAAEPNQRTKVLVIGDSVACSIVTGLERVGPPALEVEQASVLGCGVVADEIWDKVEPFPTNTDQCHHAVTGLIANRVKRFNPDVVLWISTWERFNLIDGDRELRSGTLPWRRALQHRFDRAVGLLSRNGAHVVVATVASPAPAGIANGSRLTSSDLDWRFTALNEQLRAFAERHPDKVSLVDVAKEVCPDGPPCPSRVGPIEPREIDGTHFPAVGSVWISHWMLPTLLTASVRNQQPTTGR